MKIRMTVAIAICISAIGCAQESQEEPKILDGGKEADVKTARDISEHKSGKWSPELNHAERATIFAVAEDTLKWCVSDPEERFSFDKYEITEKLKQPMHTFVTLKRKNGDLRGCIGSLPPMTALPLYQSVHQNAIYSALRDTRFSAVSPRELGDIDIHISLLSPVTEIASADDFIIGEHGIIVEKGMRHGVFLPEVAVEQKWTKEETLTYLCLHKAGLPANAWKEGATLKVFSSVVLSR